MNVLVTGGAGFIGSATVEALRRRGDKVVVLDNLSSGHRASLDSSVSFYRGDTANARLVSDILTENRIEAVAHFAAFISVPESVAKPDMYFENNTVNTLRLLTQLKDCGVKSFVFSSTAATYGEPQYHPIDEKHPTNPTNPYGESKLLVEKALADFDAAHGLKSVSLRYFNAAGGYPERGEDHSPETHLIPLVLQVSLGQRDFITIYGDDYPTEDGTCVRDYIHVEDLAQAHLKALDYLAGGGRTERINLGNGKGYTVRQVIDVAQEVTAREIAVKIGERRPGDAATLVASAEKARRVLDWSPQHPDLRTMIESAWSWHKTHPNGYGCE